MDDLSGMSWSNTTNTTQASTKGTGNYYPSLRPNPSPGYSGTSTPLSSHGSGNANPHASIPKSSTPVNDSFSNLVSFGSSKASSNLSLQEQQKKLQAEKEKKAAEQRSQYDAQFGHTQFWDGMGKTTGTGGIPSIPSINSPPILQASRNPFSKPFSPPPTSTVSSNSDEADLFAAFNADAPVDKSSHYPPPSAFASGRNTPQISQPPNIDLTAPSAWESGPAASSTMGDFGDDDDPFGLAQMAKKRNNVEALPSGTVDDDDFLGDLGKPVEEVKRKTIPVPEPRSPSSSSDEPADSDDPWDKAVRDIADMGFSEQQARRALTENGSGVNVQAAVSWLLNEAHQNAKNKSKVGQTSQNESRHRGQTGEDTSAPSRAHNRSRDHPVPERESSRSPANGEVDLSKTAAAVGSNLFKTANSLWKTSQKKMQKAVADFQTEPDSSRPKWMQEAAIEDARASQRQASGGERRQRSPRRAVPVVTDEALMLESGGPPERRSKTVAESRKPTSRPTTSRDHSPALSASTGRSTPQPRWQHSAPPSGLDPKSRLSKQAIEEQSAQAYVSPGRRKKVSPPEPKDEPDLLFGSTEPGPPPRTRISPQINASRTPSLPSKPSTPIPVRPKAPPRSIPPVSPSALASSNQHRLAGTAHFKRGDYASAHSSYSSSLASLPSTHPITIIVLCNRSLTALKTGDPKAAVADADNALTLIGPSRGENETISLAGAGSGEDVKEMREFFGKALMRKAEALEQMERWADAGTVWKEAVEAGVGAATAIQGRARCEKALAPKPKPAAPRAQQARPRPSALNDLKPASAQSTAAVNRLREANKAAEKADDEKFALSDAIEAKIEKWKGGKADNLRALLGSLDQVLWPEAGWKKVGLHELVLSNKVKIVYMKAIAKVHPDKISPTATTEVRMLSENVFSILNSAWDAFRKENGM